MRRPEAEQPATACGHPNRAAGVGAEREIHQSRGHCRGRAGGRAAGNAVRTGQVQWRAVMRVHAFEAEGELVGDGLAGEFRTRREELLHGRRRSRRGRMRPQPVRIAAAGDVARDIDQVLDRKVEAAQPARAGRLQGGTRPRNERADVGLDRARHGVGSGHLNRRACRAQQ